MEINSNSKRLVHIYLLLLMLYYGQGFLFGEGVIARLLLVCVVGLSFYYWVYAVTKYKLPAPLRFLSALIVIWTIYGIPPIIFGSQAIVSVGRETFYYIKSIYIALLPIFAFYVFAKKDLLTEDIIRKWFVVFLVIAVGEYYHNLQTRLEMLSEFNGNVTETTNNSGYTMVSLLCLVPIFHRKPLIQYAVIAICLAFAVASFKRGAIACGALCTGYIIFSSLFSKKAKSRINWRIVALVLILIVVGYYFINSLLLSSDFFLYRIEDTREGSSSGRDSIYFYFFNHFVNQSTFFTFLFGNGAYGTVELFNSFAHNDWLEIAIDNGFFVLILYFVYWFSYLPVIKHGDNTSVYKVMLVTFVLLYFTRSFISMSYNAVSPYAACALGYSLAHYQYKKRSQK